MEFELAYDLEIAVGNEVTFVAPADRHRKVRVFVTEVKQVGDTLTFAGNSLGSSFKEIKAAKKDEPPVEVLGRLRLDDGAWRGSVESRS